MDQIFICGTDGTQLLMSTAQIYAELPCLDLPDSEETSPGIITFD